MITNKTIGKCGRLGNQLFQYASLVGIAKYNNYSYCIPINQTDLHYFNITVNNCNLEELSLPNLIEDHYFDKDNIFDKPDNRSYYGYFQNYKYFDHCKDFIKRELTFKENSLIQLIKYPLDNNEFVSIHIRRQDYLNNTSLYFIPPITWYLKAMNFFTNKKFLIFSDDKPWCYEAFKGIKNVIISPFNHYIQDLYAMTKCVGHILSNSTFGWWGAYLSDTTNVIMPEFWWKTKKSFEHGFNFKLPSWKLLPL